MARETPDEFVAKITKLSKESQEHVDSSEFFKHVHDTLTSLCRDLYTAIEKNHGMVLKMHELGQKEGITRSFPDLFSKAMCDCFLTAASHAVANDVNHDSPQGAKHIAADLMIVLSKILGPQQMLEACAMTAAHRASENPDSDELTRQINKSFQDLEKKKRTMN